MSDNLTSHPVNVPSEGTNATKQSRNGILGGKKKRNGGRRRGARSMGRYPLKTTARKYMEANRTFLAESTYAERERKLRAIADRFGELCKENPELEKDPEKWTEREVSAILLDWKKRGLSLGTQKKNLGHIHAVLKYVGNGALEKMKTNMPHAIPRTQYIRGPSLNEGQIAQVLEGTERLRGWQGEVARFVMAMYAFTGLRLSELRRARYADLDPKTWTLTVRHPKGEGSYGEFRVVPIPDPIRPYLERFLKARESMLAEKGILEAEPLIPRQRGDSCGYYSANGFEVMAGKVREASGVEFDFRTLRRTYGQTLLNRGAGLQSVSLMLGHHSTLTTERYYCRQDANSARLEVLRALEGFNLGPKPVRPMIDEKSGFTGYA